MPHLTVCSGSLVKWKFRDYSLKLKLIVMHKPFILLTSFLLIFSLGCKKEASSLQINLEELTISEIHRAYETGEYSAQDLVQAYIEAIGEKDGQVNAITILNSNAVLVAKELDAEYKRTGILRQLHGVPLIVKDNINTVGLPTTAGSLALADFIPKDNAFIIDKLVEAGAIVLAKSNMAEWAFSPMHSESSTLGTTHNPYNLDYVPAGSSGGTAAAIAANMGLGGLGTDTGNSIRGPSAHTSLVGFRTTLGLISREGIVPLYLRNDVVGPMCRTVEDATRMLEVMAGYDENDPITKHAVGNISENYSQYLLKDGLKGTRVGVLRSLTDNSMDADVAHLFERAIADLDYLGAEIVDPVVIPNFASLRENQWCAIFREDLETFLETYVKRDTIQTLEDVISIGTTSEFARRRLEANAAEDPKDRGEGECLDPYHDAKRIAFREAIESVMDSLNLDAIVYPSWNDKPAHIDKFQEEYKGDNSQLIAPHTGQPAFTVPMGFSPENLPAGLQFLGRMYDEPTLIKLVYSYEQGTKHRRPPSTLR